MAGFREFRYHTTMMRSGFVAILIAVLMTWELGAETIAGMPRVNRPNNLALHGNRIYVSDCPQVHIYSFEAGNLSYIRSFGHAGSGPGEFEPNHNHFKVFVAGDQVVVYSRAKVSYFTLQGKLIRELNTISLARVLVPVQDRLVGRRLYMKGKTRYRGVALFDSRLELLKILSEDVYAMQPGNTRIPAYSTSFNLAASRDRIFTATSDDFIIRINDIQGNPIRVVQVPDEDTRVRITRERQRMLHLYLKRRAPNYPSYKNRLDFPAYFPAIRYNGFCVDTSSDPALLYALTWEKRGTDTRAYKFDNNGELLEDLWLPLREQDALLLFPYCIRGRELYQLVENPDTETFELHLTTF